MLRRHDRGRQISTLQNMLNWVGNTRLPKLDPDGVFGRKTEERVREYQDNRSLAVDGIVGPETYDALYNDFTRTATGGNLWSGGLGATSTRASKPEPPEPRAMSQAEIREFMREYSDDYERLRRGYGRHLDNFVFCLARANDMVSLMRAVGFLDQTARTGVMAASGGVISGIGGVAGIFIWYYTALRQWANALTASRRTYAYRGACYTATAWFFDQNPPTRSDRIWNRISQFRDPEPGPGTRAVTMVDYRDAWNDARNKTWQELQTADFEGADHSVVKPTVQALFGEDPAALCLAFLQSFEGVVGSQQLGVWRDNYSVRYPN